MSHLTWIAWDRPLGDDNYTSRATGRPTGGMPARLYRTVRYDCALSPVSLSLSSLPFLSVAHSFVHLHTSTSLLLVSWSVFSCTFSFRAYVKAAVFDTGVRASLVNTLWRTAIGAVSSAVSIGKYRGRTRRRDLRYRAYIAARLAHEDAKPPTKVILSSFTSCK